MGAFASGLGNALAKNQSNPDTKIRIGKKKDKDGDFDASTGPEAGGLGPEAETAEPADYRKGGRVRKGGIAKVERGEFVLTSSQAKRLKKGIGRKRA